MKLNERGATLAVVLLVILVFSVLGLALMGSTVNENKRVNVTESDVQARYLAESGLTYFEQDFNNYIKNTDTASLNFNNYLNNYKNYKSVGDSSNPGETQIKAEMNSSNNITVTSIGKAGSFKKTLIGYYKISYDEVIQKPSFELMKFDKEGTIAVDFTKQSLAYVNLLNLIKVDLLNLTGGSRYNQVPNDSAFSVDVLNPILGINIPSGDSFKTMRDYRVIASDDGKVLGLNLINLPINLLPYQGVEDTNVLINGFVPGITLLGIPLVSAYNDIDFKKLAVMGNTLIQTSNSSARRFTFAEGLYVNKSIIMGNSSSVSTLMLRGNMVAMKDLTICNAALTFGDSNTNETSLKPEDYTSNLYVWGNAEIENSTISLKNSQNGQYAFNLLVDHDITIDNNISNNIYYGVFYSKEGMIHINTNGKSMLNILAAIFAICENDASKILTMQNNSQSNEYFSSRLYFLIMLMITRSVIIEAANSMTCNWTVIIIGSSIPYELNQFMSIQIYVSYR